MPSSSSSRFFMPILCLLAALGIFSTSLYLPSLPAVGRELDASQEAVQLTLALFFLGSAIGSLLLGPLADRWGRLKVAKGGLILFILTSFWCAESQTILSLQIARFIQGMASSSGPLVARAMGRDLYEGTSLTQFSATIMMVISISPAIAPTLGGLIEVYLGWEINFYFLMLFGVFIAILVWTKLRETKNSLTDSLKLSSILKNYTLLFKNLSYAMFCLVLGLQMAAIFCYIALSPYLFISLFKWSPEAYGLVGITSAFGNIVGFAIARHLAHRLYVHTGILIGSVLSFFLCLIFVSVCFFIPANATFLILFSVCFYCGAALAISNASAGAMNLFPHMAGVSSAMVGAIQIGAGAFGSALAGLLPVSPLLLGAVMGVLSFSSFVAGVLIQKKTWLGR